MSSARAAAGSARQRLLSRSRRRGEDYQVLLVRYALERFVYRLSVSRHADRFVLKGAMLFALWADTLDHRPTRDIDLLGRGNPSPAELAAAFRELCLLEVAVDDGLEFDEASVAAAPIREDAVYDGVRVVLRARLGTARIRIQVDVGFGDAVHPVPEIVAYPTLLDHPAPEVAAYHPATVVAEKLEAMVALGMANSRMKDFFDLLWMADHMELDGDQLVAAVRSTFLRRQRALPQGPPIALTVDFAEDGSKQVQWGAFIRKSRLDGREGGLPEVVGCLSAFLGPLLESATGDGSPGHWSPGGPWRREQRR